MVKLIKRFTSSFKRSKQSETDRLLTSYDQFNQAAIEKINAKLSNS